MKTFLAVLVLVARLVLACGALVAPPGTAVAQEAPGAVPAGPASAPAVDAGELPPYLNPHGHARPLVAIVGENYWTELTDYVVPYGILAASGAAEVVALATQPAPIRMFPAPVNVQPQSTTAAFDAAHPEGADYVVVLAVHRDADPTLLA